MEAASGLAAGNSPPWVLRKQTLPPPPSTQFIRSPISTLHYPLKLRLFRRHLSHATPRCSNESGSEQPKSPSLDQALKFCYAINEGNIHGIMDSMNQTIPLPKEFIPLLWFLKGKEVALQIFSALLKLVRNNVEFIIIPKDDGTVVGVSWRLVWRTTHQPTGKDCSFDTAHVYRGRVFIRNMEKLLDPVQELMVFLSQRSAAFLGWSGDQEKTWWRQLMLVVLLFVAVCSLVIRKPNQ